MTRKLSLLAAMLIAVSSGCGRTGAAYQEGGQDTAVTSVTEESSAETSAPTHSAFEEKFSIIPSLRFGMNETEMGEVYKSQYTRSTENLSGSGPQYIRYTAPF